MAKQPAFLSRFPAYPRPSGATSLANDIRRRAAASLDWLIARDDAGERKQVAFLAIAALVLVLMIAGVKP